MCKDDALRPHPDTFLFQASENVHLVHVLFQIARQNIQIVLRDCKTAMTEYLLERDHRTAHDRPFLRKGMTEPVNACLLQSPFVAIVPDGVIATASRQLLSVDGTEQPVIFISSAIVQILLENFENVFVQRDNQRLAVLCGIDIDNRVIKVYVFNLDIDQTVLPNAGRKQEVDNHPTAIRREDALVDIRLSQELAQFFIRVCLDRRFVRFWWECLPFGLPCCARSASGLC